MHFCLKVNRDLSSFDRECKAHLAIAATHLAEGVNFYATGAVRNAVASVHYPLNIPKEQIVPLAVAATKKAVRTTTPFTSLVDAEVFWTDLTTTKRKELHNFDVDESKFYNVCAGGVTFMLPGRQPKYTSHDDRLRWLNGVQRSLLSTHRAGYYHCDLRLTNILNFDNGVQIIDYDLATSAENAVVTFRRGGAQWDGAGRRIRAILDAEPFTQQDVEVVYTAIDDHEMVERSMLNIFNVQEITRMGGRITSGGGSSGGSSRSGASTDIDVRSAFSFGASGLKASVSAEPLNRSYIEGIIKATTLEESDTASAAPRTATNRKTLQSYFNTSADINRDISSEEPEQKKKKSDGDTDT